MRILCQRSGGRIFRGMGRRLVRLGLIMIDGLMRLFVVCSLCGID